jgi:pimeloyl-ACP methyl ester carboxylesterase
MKSDPLPTPNLPVGEWQGFRVHSFDIEGRTAILVEPDKACPSRIWAWKPEFFGAFPGLELELLRRGIFVFYLDLPDHYGCPEAVRVGDLAYAKVIESHALHRRTSFIALSRGGLFAFNWAAANPDKVACIYADNPVCDFKSWPAGWGSGPGSALDWQTCLARYGLDEASARQYAANPIDHIPVIAGHKISVLHVIGDKDDLVPVEENSGIIKSRMGELGGDYREIVRHGQGHHPHGLDDCSPIADFFANCGKWQN